MEQLDKDSRAVERIIHLMIKTGLFFGCVDGEYADAERQFIENFAQQLQQAGPIDEVQDMLDHATDHQYTLDEIIADTKALLDEFDSPNERQMVTLALYQFIDNVIKADGVEHPAEHEAFIAWGKALANKPAEEPTTLL